MTQRMPGSANMNDSLLKAKEAIEWLDNKTLLNEFEALQQKIKKDDFYLAITGSFKRGKSSLLNALLEKQVAPTGIIPVTAVVTIIGYGKNETVTVHYENGKQERIEKSKIYQYVAEEENPNNEKKVKFLSILLPLEWLQGMRIIDTPGIGSGHLHNTEEAFSFIPQIDMALYVLSAELPISQEDLRFLKALKAQTPALYLVLNKSDLVTREAQEALLQHNRQMMTQNWKDTVPDILPVSSLSKDKTSIRTLKKQINRIHKEKKSEILTYTLKKRIKTLLQKTASLLKSQEETLLLPKHELEAEIQQIKKLRENLREEKNEYVFRLEGRIKHLQQTAHELVDTYRKELYAYYAEELHKNKLQVLTALQEEGYEAVEQKFARRVLDDLKRAKENAEQDIIARFKKQLETDQAQSGQFLEQLIQGTRLARNLHSKDWLSHFDLNIYSGFYFREISQYKAGRGSSIYLPGLLPPQWRRKRQFRQLRQDIQSVIFSNAANSVADMQYKIQESYRKFHARLIEEQLHLLDSLEKATEEARKRQRSGLSEINPLLNQLKKWNTTIHNTLPTLE